MILDLKQKVRFINLWRTVHNLAKILIINVQRPMLTVLTMVVMILMIDANKHVNLNKIKVNFNNAEPNVKSK